jgi:hypothetical protein
MRKPVELGLIMLLVSTCVVCVGHAQETALEPPSKELLDLAADEDGYKPLFKEDLSNAEMQEGGWTWEDGVLTAKGNGDIWTKERYGDFILDLEFKCDPDTNSGVFIRCDSLKNWLHTAIEVQVLQPNDKYGNDRHHCGGIFDCLAPAKQMVKAPGEWNRYVIIARGNMIWVYLNDELVVSMDLDQWTEAGKNPDGTKNKFKYAYKDLVREGHIGLQEHGHPVWFRNLKVKPLEN